MSADIVHPELPELDGRRILLGVTGGIAAYKAVELTRLLKKAGSEVQVLMTPGAERFITALTLGTVSERPVLSEVFPENEEGSWTKHITLGRWADLFVVAPATAQTIAKLASGHCDNMLTATALAARCPLLVCPAMDHDMFVHPATQRNLRVLSGYGYDVMQPEHGELASGLVGTGRLPEPARIVDRIAEIVQQDPDEPDAMKGVRVLVTAGPTREHLDPVRFISNPSSGRMGFALADRAARRGAHVVLITGPTRLDTPPNVDRIDIESTEEMYQAVMRHADADIIIMAAAVSDYRPSERSQQKIKKEEGALTLQLQRTPDILRELGSRRRDAQILVGFAAETEHGLENARGKLASKNADWIVLNVLGEGSGFEVDTNRVTILGRDGFEEELPLMSKQAAAGAILDRITSSSRNRAS